MEVEDFITKYGNGDPAGLRRALQENFRALSKLYGCPHHKIQVYRESYQLVHDALRNGPWNLNQASLNLLDQFEDDFLSYFNQLQEC